MRMFSKKNNNCNLGTKICQRSDRGTKKKKYKKKHFFVLTHSSGFKKIKNVQLSNYDFRGTALDIYKTISLMEPSVSRIPRDK